MVNDSGDNYGLSNMTKDKIVSLCKKHKLYVTPRLNDVLYLHYQGFTEIKELDEYVGLKCLYLECNAISQISGLENQSELRCLLLQNNVIKKIENLQHCVHLDLINLSHNFITIIENLGSDILPELNTLTITNNSLRTEESIANLVHCKNLSVLDLSNNRIDDIVIVKILGQMPELKVLVLTGNPVVNQIPSYRKTLILSCKRLTYLDARPVFDVDRACAEAWKRGGYEEERKERMRWNQEERRKLTSSIYNTTRMGGNESTEMENNLISTNEDEEQNHNLDSIPQMLEVAGNYNSDDTSSSQESNSNEFLELTDNYRNSDVFIKGNSIETYFVTIRNNVGNSNHQDVLEINEDTKNNKTNSTGTNFLASLEQIVSNDCSSKEVTFHRESQLIQDLTANVDIEELEDLVVPRGNRNSAGSILIEEIKESEPKCELVESGMTSLPDCIELVEITDNKENSKFTIKNQEEHGEATEANIPNNSAKITFYCENVNKLIDDTDGEEYDEPIQEMTQVLDNFI